MASPLKHAKRVAIGIIGGLVLLVGLVTVPYPGPGWLTVFAGLAILASEFDWAQRLLDSARARYDLWQTWLKSQNKYVRFLVAMMTAIIVVITIYLLNG